jgi:hypothetical protein
MGFQLPAHGFRARQKNNHTSISIQQASVDTNIPLSLYGKGNILRIEQTHQQ